MFIQRQPFFMVVEASNLPHPDKAATGGEDSFFISPDMYSFGVFDGVGGWNDRVCLFF